MRWPRRGATAGCEIVDKAGHAITEPGVMDALTAAVGEFGGRR